MMLSLEKDFYLESLRQSYRKKIWRKFIKGIKDFNLIEDGDKIAVGVSGGKDSLILCKLFQELKRDKSKNFEVVFISMDPGFSKEDLLDFKENLIKLKIPCEIFGSNVWDVAFREEPDNPCFLCAKMRRGVLYNKVEELGCNKLALGHHFDDIVETGLINMFYAGTIKTMIPKVNSTSGKLTVIRPMAYIKEKDIISYMNKNEISPMGCGCSVQSGEKDSKRLEIKQLLSELEKNNSNIKQSIFNSLRNVNLDYIMGYTKGNKNG